MEQSMKCCLAFGRPKMVSDSQTFRGSYLSLVEPAFLFNGTIFEDKGAPDITFKASQCCLYRSIGKWQFFEYVY